MANIKTSAGIESITGLLDKDTRIVTRRHTYKDPLTGEVIGYGPNEYYIQKASNKPFTTKQKESCRKFTIAAKVMKEIVSNKQHPRYMEMYTAFVNQLNSEKPIKSFTSFICATLYKEML